MPEVGNCSNFERFLINADKVINFIPGLSTVVGLVNLVIKGIFTAANADPTQSHYVKHIKDKSLFKNIALMIPGVNIVVACLILSKKHNYKLLENEKVEIKLDSWSYQLRQNVNQLCVTIRLDLVQNAPELALKLIGDFLKNAENKLPNHLQITFLNKDGSPMEGLDAGALSKDFLSHCIRALAKSTYDPKNSCFKNAGADKLRLLGYLLNLASAGKAKIGEVFNPIVLYLTCLPHMGEDYEGLIKALEQLTVSCSKNKNQLQDPNYVKTMGLFMFPNEFFTVNSYTSTENEKNIIENVKFLAVQLQVEEDRPDWLPQYDPKNNEENLTDQFLIDNALNIRNAFALCVLKADDDFLKFINKEEEEEALLQEDCTQEKIIEYFSSKNEKIPKEISFIREGLFLQGSLNNRKMDNIPPRSFFLEMEEDIQGKEVTKESVLEKHLNFSVNNEFKTFLEEWIKNASEEQFKNFLIFICSGTSLSSNEKLEIKTDSTEDIVMEAHSCFGQLVINPEKMRNLWEVKKRENPQITLQEAFNNFLELAIQQKDYNIK